MLIGQYNIPAMLITRVYNYDADHMSSISLWAYIDYYYYFVT